MVSVRARVRFMVRVRGKCPREGKCAGESRTLAGCAAA